MGQRLAYFKRGLDYARDIGENETRNTLLKNCADFSKNFAERQEFQREKIEKCIHENKVLLDGLLRKIKVNID